MEITDFLLLLSITISMLALVASSNNKKKKVINPNNWKIEIIPPLKSKTNNMDKEQQKKLLTEIMEADEKNGLYKQQTAVEWLWNVLADKGYFKKLPISEIKQAKQKEKEQIVDAHIEGQRVFDKHDHTQWTTDQAEQYYIETYKNK